MWTVVVTQDHTIRLDVFLQAIYTLTTCFQLEISSLSPCCCTSLILRLLVHVCTRPISVVFCRLLPPVPMPIDRFPFHYQNPLM